MTAIAIRMAGYQPARSVHTRALHRLAHGLRERLGSAVAVAVTDNVTAAGRRADDLLAMVDGDDLDICYFSSSYLAARVPSLALFDRPFHFAGRAAFYETLDGNPGRRMAEDLEGATAFRALAFWDNGIRHISNGRRPIRRPEDCAGLRIRTLNNAMHQAFFHKLGFEPVFLDVKDLAKAVADGSVDAQENPLTNIVNFNLQRHHRFVSLTAHVFGVALLLVNRRRFDGWPGEVRDALRDAVAGATAEQRREAEQEDTACRAQLLAEGVDILDAPELDRAAFARAAA